MEIETERGVIELPLRATALSPSKSAEISVGVYLFSGGQPSGTLRASGSEEALPFRGLMELMFTIECMLDSMNFPQAYFEYRSFSGKCAALAEKKRQNEVREYMEGMEKEFMDDEKTPRSTFVVDVLFRQNATWQGTISWVDKKQTKRFRSSLELMKLIDEALETEFGADEGYTGWEQVSNEHDVTLNISNDATEKR